MALSDSPNNPNRVPRRSTDATQHRWSDNQKIECVKTFLVTGNLRQAAAMLRIPEQTVRSWRQSNWWKEIEGELRLQDELQLSQRLQSVIGRSLDVVEDRLEKGDFLYDQKTGQMRRRPVSARDANKIAQDNMTRRDLIESRPQNIETKEATADKLLKLAQKFAELAGAAKKEENTLVLENDGLSGEVYVAPDSEEDDSVAEEEQSGSPGFSAM